MRRRVLLASLLSLVFVVVPARARAQSVKGVVVDDSSKLAIEGVLIALVDGRGEEQPRTVRSDSGGAFVIHAPRPGSYRVRATRIGYRPVTSDPVSLNVGYLAVTRLRMVTLAQQLIAVRVVERRPMNAAELMSTTGFDLRESKGLGTFIGKDRLAAMGHDGVRDILATQFQPTLYIRDDPVVGEVVRIRQGRSECAPEIFLDGQLLSTSPDAMAIIDSSAIATPMDTLRLLMTVEGEVGRLSASQIYAMSVLANLRAVDLHGIEMYRSNQTLPPSLGAWFGSTKRATRPCGTLAVWTTNGRGLPVVAARSRRVDGLQIVSGRVVNIDTNEPVPAVPVTLLNDARDPVGQPIRSNARGEFTIRTTRVGLLRLRAGSIGYGESTTPAFALSTDELVFVQLFVSAKEALLAPLGVRARVLPTTFGLTDRGGFTYRRERADRGAFFGTEEMETSRARTLAELVGRIPGIRTSGLAADTIMVVPDDDLPQCRPVYYRDGVIVTGEVEEMIGSLSLDRLLGVEVYARPSDVPAIFRGAVENCGLIALWTKG